MQTLDITAANGVPFRVVFYLPGESGPYPAAKSAVASLVEFYDARYPHTEHGQFTGGRYYAETLMGHSNGLNLAGQEPKWRIDAVTWNDRVFPFLRNCYENAAEDTLALEQD